MSELIELFFCYDDDYRPEDNDGDHFASTWGVVSRSRATALESARRELDALWESTHGDVEDDSDEQAALAAAKESLGVASFHIDSKLAHVALSALLDITFDEARAILNEKEHQ